jgi:hypothetical protein
MSFCVSCFKIEDHKTKFTYFFLSSSWDSTRVLDTDVMSAASHSRQQRTENLFLSKAGLPDFS